MLHPRPSLGACSEPPIANCPSRMKISTPADPRSHEGTFLGTSLRLGAVYAWGDEFAPGRRMMANTWQGEFPWQNLLTDGYEGTSPSGCDGPGPSASLLL